MREKFFNPRVFGSDRPSISAMNAITGSNVWSFLKRAYKLGIMQLR